MDNNVADMLMRSAHFIVEQSMNLTLDRQVDGQVEVNHFLTIRPLDPNDPVWTDNLGNRTLRRSTPSCDWCLGRGARLAT
jgi:hypothetical protein